MLQYLFCFIGWELISAGIYKYIRKMTWENGVRMIKRLFPAVLFLSITYAIYTPSSLFLENINEFSFHYIEIVPIILCVTFLLWSCLIGVALCIVKEETEIYYIALIFSISLGIYFQGNFLNPKFPALDGTKIDWSVYSTRIMISSLFWILCISVILGLSFRWKNKSEQLIKYISYFLSAVQLVALIVMIVTNKLQNTTTYGFAKEKEFTIGSEENIVIFVVDTLQASVLEKYLVSDAYTEGELDDFTFFDNAVSGGSPTSRGMPVLLTGCEYDPLQKESEYLEEIWEEASLYDCLHENGYDIRFYSDSYYSIPGISDRIIDNFVVGSKKIRDHSEFCKKLYQLVNFYLVPQALKERFWLSTDELMDTTESVEGCYKLDDAQFYQDMCLADELRTDYKKTMRLYHFRGVHEPYITNQNLEVVDAGSVTEQQVLQGVMKEIYCYLDYMKEAGVYDNSIIIIAGDHGRHEEGNPGAHPALLIKRPNEAHALTYASVPVHYRNIIATIAETVISDYSVYGPSVYDITELSDVERLHTIDTPVRDRNWIDDEWDKAAECRLIVPDNPDEIGKYQIWNPYDINCVNYSLGENIDFASVNDYAELINYRLYKENGVAIASNELSICFNLVDYKGGDLEFHYIYSKVYNDRQTMRIYANGSRVDTVACINERINEDNAIKIPESKIDNDIIVIRIVFPNAIIPNQVDRTNTDMRILSVAFKSVRIDQVDEKKE